MIQRCIYLFLLAAHIVGCQQKVKPIPGLEFVLIDSLQLQEKNGFLSQPHLVGIVSDSILAATSFKSKGIWFFDLETGEEISSILSGKVMGTSFMPSGVIWDAYPEVKVVDGSTQKIHVFRINQDIGSDSQERAKDGVDLLSSVTLKAPDDFKVATFMTFFEEFDGKYYVSIRTTKTLPSKINYFRDSGEVIGVFDLDGNHIENILSFPKSLQDLQGYIVPYLGYGFGSGESGAYFTFGSERELVLMGRDWNSSRQFEVFKLPESRFFDYKLQFIENEHNGMNTDLSPSTHYLKPVHEERGFVYLQSKMRDNTKLGQFVMLTHIFRYNKSLETWEESDEAFNFLELGDLAGIKQDTLYFVEASLINRDQKWMKRAVLKSKG
ncbi:MAG: hypothetical protein LPJ98_03245 [Cyclobacteriaceae bacterium]|nr:hypothetical protein [Cyclobacteriaceae bacterium]